MEKYKDKDHLMCYPVVSEKALFLFTKNFREIVRSFWKLNRNLTEEKLVKFEEKVSMTYFNQQSSMYMPWSVCWLLSYFFGLWDMHFASFVFYLYCKICGKTYSIKPSLVVLPLLAVLNYSWRIWISLF